MSLNTILKWITIGGLFLIPFTVLIAPPLTNSLFFPYIVGKNVFFRVIVEIIFAAWLILALRDSRFRPQFSWLIVSFLSFLGIIFLADIFGDDFSKSFWSNYERMEGFITFLHLFGLFIVAGTTLATEKMWKWFFHVSIFVSIVVGISALIQLGEGEVSRLDVYLGNAIYLAIYSVFHIFLSLFYLLRLKSFRPGLCVAYGATILLQAFVLFNTGTRGAILALGAGLFVVAVLWALFERERRYLRFAAFAFLGLCVIGVGSFFALRDTSFVKQNPTLERFSQISLTEGTVAARLDIWNIAWDGFTEKPLLGWGQGNFSYVFNKYYTPDLYDDEEWFDRTHNVFLDWTIAGGVVGVIAYLSLFAVFFFYLFKPGANNFSFVDKSILTGLMVAYFVHNMAVFDNIVSYILFVSVLAFMYALHKKPEEGKVENISLKPETVNYVAIPLVIIALIGSLYVVNVRTLRANTSLIEGLQYSKLLSRADTDTQATLLANGSLEAFQDSLSEALYDKKAIREQMATAARRVNRSSVSSSTKTDFLTTTEKELQRQLDEDPKDARIYIAYGLFLEAQGKFERAEEIFLKAHELSPRKQSFLFQLGSLYIETKQYTKALDVFEKAYNLEKSYTDARVRYAVSAVYAQKEELAEDLISKLSKDSRSDSRLIQAYAEIENYEKIIELRQSSIENLESKLRENPSNDDVKNSLLQQKLSLAAAYVKNNQRQEAVEEIRTLIQLAPDFEKRGEGLIERIQSGEDTL